VTPVCKPIFVALSRTRGAAGFTLLEVLISVALTLIVMAVVFQLTRQLEAIYRAESRAVEASSGAVRALDEMTSEIARAGYGLGDAVPPVVPCASESSPRADCIFVRSNPEGIAGRLGAELGPEGGPVPVDGGEDFRDGDRVLLVDRPGRTERAVVSSATGSRLAFRSLETESGELKSSYSPEAGARVLKLREVGFWRDPPSAGQARLLKEEGETRAVAEHLAGLEFNYLDPEGTSLAPARVVQGQPVATVRLRMELAVPEAERSRRPALPVLATAVSLDRQSLTVDFEDKTPGLRLSRIFYPIAQPAGVAARPRARWAVLLASGKNPTQDPAYLYSFLLEKQFLQVSADGLLWLDDVRRPVALSFGPEGGPLAGSLFLAAWGLRRGHLARVFPDAGGALSPQSKVQAFDGTESLAMVGGVSFGLDGALYVSSQENGGLFRCSFDKAGRPLGAPQAVARFEGSPGAMASGADGNIYLLVDEGGEGSLWSVPFDVSLSAGAPRRLGRLPGAGRSLALDPLGNALYALLVGPDGDTVVVEIPSSWIRDPTGPLSEVFRLSRFRRELEEGKLPPGSMLLPTALVPEKLDFLAFDALGALYLGAGEKNLVLKFDFTRPGPGLRHAVGVAAVVEPSGEGFRVRLHTWKKGIF
jgi:hypothetical protein